MLFNLFIAIQVVLSGLSAQGQSQIQFLDEELQRLNRINSGLTPENCLQTSHQGKKVALTPRHMEIPGEGGSRRVLSYEITQPVPEFATADAAAIFAVTFVRKRFKDSEFVEYCTSIEKNQRKKYEIRYFNRGENGSCRPRQEKKNSIQVHTHPGQNSDLGLTAQIPSAADYAAAAYHKSAHYMGGPAGQVLRYSPKDIECRGSMIRYKFTEVLPPQKPKSNYDHSSSFRLMDESDKQYKSLLCPQQG